MLLIFAAAIFLTAHCLRLLILLAAARWLRDRDAGGLRPGKRLLLHAVATLQAMIALPGGNC
jgi:hypothetical protein